jgi:RimJ/RimL family protein N-acetyltransferase
MPYILNYKGYGSEAVKIILEYGFNNLGLERITANTLEQNKAAQRSLEKKEEFDELWNARQGISQIKIL